MYKILAKNFFVRQNFLSKHFTEITKNYIHSYRKKKIKWNEKKTHKHGFIPLKEEHYILMSKNFYT